MNHVYFLFDSALRHKNNIINLKILRVSFLSMPLRPGAAKVGRLEGLCEVTITEPYLGGKHHTKTTTALVLET